MFANSAAVVQAAFADEIVDSGRNSELVELADDHVLVLRVAAHHVPTTKPLDEVREQIREELIRERAQQLAEEAAQAFLAAHRARWRPGRARDGSGRHLDAGRRGSMRTDQRRADGSAVGRVRHAEGDAAAPQREIIALANGGQAVIVLTGVEAGEPASMTQDGARSTAAAARRSSGAGGAHGLRRQRPRRGQRPYSRRHPQPAAVLRQWCPRLTRGSRRRATDIAGCPSRERREYVPVGSLRAHPCARAPRETPIRGNPGTCTLQLVLAGFGVGCGEGHADDVEAGVDVEDLAGDAGGEVGAEERGGVADVLDRDVALERRGARRRARSCRGCL